jgi:PhzF family phenazine biosynthesis protein
MALPVYVVDAFTQKAFKGNPAAVCPLEAWPSDHELQAIASEMALSETAFIVPRRRDYHIRWFTPTMEIDLCGHATLAAALVVFDELGAPKDQIVFHSQSGPLSVARENGRLVLDFPERIARPIASSGPVLAALGVAASEVLQARDTVVVVKSAEIVRTLQPNFEAIAALPTFAVAVTAPGTGHDSDVDYVLRFFSPGSGIPEDPVTGSAHCSLAPYWAKVLGKSTLRARQVSKRGGEIWLEHVHDRVRIAGHAVMTLRGSLLP